MATPDRDDNGSTAHTDIAPPAVALTHEPPREEPRMSHPGRCRANRTDGQPCRSRPSRGYDRCAHHRPAAPDETPEIRAALRYESDLNRRLDALLALPDAAFTRRRRRR